MRTKFTGEKLSAHTAAKSPPVVSSQCNYHDVYLSVQGLLVSNLRMKAFLNKILCLLHITCQYLGLG